MNPEAEKLCEEIDAALFSADTFQDQLSITGLTEYIERWQRHIDEYWRNFQAEDK